MYSDVQYDANALADFARSPNAGSDPRRDATKNRVEFTFDYKVDHDALKKGKPFNECFKKRLFVKIATPTTKDIAYIPASETDKQLYSGAYEAFMHKQRLEEEGTPITLVKQFQGAVRDCYRMGIYTIEQLAAFDQAEIGKNDLQVFQTLANRWVKRGQSAAAHVGADQQEKAKRGRPKKQVD